MDVEISLVYFKKGDYCELFQTCGILNLTPNALCKMNGDQTNEYIAIDDVIILTCVFTDPSPILTAQI